MPRVALAHGTDNEMAEAQLHHHQHAGDPAQPGSGPSISAFDLERPPQEKKKKKSKNMLNKIVPTNMVTTEPVADEVIATEPNYIASHQFPQLRPVYAATYLNDGELADLIKRSISKLIPTIAGEAVRQMNRQIPTSTPTTDTPLLYPDQDIDMDVIRLRDDALNSRQIGRVPGHPWPADIIPAVQQKLLNQIQHGEFIEFNLLLPSHAPPLTDNYLVDIVDDNTGEPSISIDRAQSRAKIFNFQSRLKAWNIYLRCLVHFHSHLITQLLYYQSQITQFTPIYPFQTWSLYDRLFRLRVASKAIARWDFDDVELRSQHLVTAQSNPTCWSCKQSGHYSVNCPAKSGRSTLSSPG